MLLNGMLQTVNFYMHVSHDQKRKFAREFRGYVLTRTGGSHVLGTTAGAGEVKENTRENAQPISNEDEEVAEPILGQDEEYNGFYILSCKEFGTSPDKLRENLENALHTLSTSFRRHPTLPADPANPVEYMKEACDDTVGLLLPRKHCALKNCMWHGSDDMALIEHIEVNHYDALRPAINAFHALKFVHCKDSEVVALSMYNEGIATAIRQGAPLASYSIDRRCTIKTI